MHGNQVVDQLRRLGHELHCAETKRDDRTIGRPRTVAAIPEILRDVDAIYMRCLPRRWDMAMLEINRRTTRRPVVVEMNAPPDERAPENSWWHRPPLRQLRAGWRGGTYGRIVSHASAVICVSEELARDVRRRYRVSASRMHVVPNGGCLPEGPPMQVASRPDGPIRVVWMGSRFWPMQAFDDVLASLRLLVERRPDVEVHVYTDGEEPIGDDRLVKHAPIPHAEVPAMLRMMHLGLCLRSADGWYTSPLKLFDYMAAGVVVIGSNQGQIAEVIEDDVSGKLVPVGDPSAIADAMVTLVDRPRDALEAMGRAAATRIAERYTWDHTGDRIGAVLESLGVR